MKNNTLIILCLFLNFSFSQNIVLQDFASGFNSPVSIKHADDSRLFVVERQGYIKILNSDGSTNSTSFLNIDERITNNGGEQGLLALAFHPNYTNNGFFYVNYIGNDENTRISRFSRLDANTADPNSEVVMLTISQPFSNHNGGDMHFGTDGFLYISLGDGGSGGDPQNLAQNLNSFLGKMLRLDVNVTQEEINADITYKIPSDNPFVDNANALDEIWAYGLRNPFKFSFDRENGDLWIADVGQAEIEEINRVPTTSSGGENYGWKCYEGTSVYSTGTGCSTITHEEPIAQYNHSGGTFFRCSITGGYRYRGTEQLSFQGLYFFADYCSNELGYVQETTPNEFEITFLSQFPGEGFSSFGEDINGELYVASLLKGNIYKLTQESLGIKDANLSRIKMYPNPSISELNFDTSGSSTQIENITIYNLQGKIIKTVSGIEEQNISISTQNMASGLYIIEIASANGDKESRKLIVN